jgi:hypothetical protein
VVWATEEAVQTASNSVWTIEADGNGYRFENQAAGRGYLTIKNGQAVWSNGEANAATRWLLEPVGEAISARIAKNKKVKANNTFIQNFRVFPNPSNGSFGVADVSGTIEVYDLLGVKITEAVAHEGVAKLQLKVRPGVYVVRSAHQRAKILIE